MGTHGDEDIPPVDIQEVPPLDIQAIQGPTTRACAWQLNLEVSFLLSVSINSLQNGLLPNDYIMIRNQGDDQRTHEEEHGAVEEQQGTSKSHGGPMQLNFESTS
jgi:hypothetical protein